MTKKQAFLKHYLEGEGIISYAAQKASVTRRTYYNWIAKDPKFLAKCEEVLEECKDDVESKLLANVKKGHQRAIEFWLLHKASDRGYVKNVNNNVVIDSNPFMETMKAASIVDSEKTQKE